MPLNVINPDLRFSPNPQKFQTSNVYNSVLTLQQTCRLSYFNTCTVHLLLFCTMNQQRHRLSHSSYMFRHCHVILKEFVASTLPSYTGMSNAAVGNIIYNLKLFHILLQTGQFNILKILNTEINSIKPI